MKKIGLSLSLLLCIFLITNVGIGISHAITMRITEGTITSASGSTSLKGKVDFWGPTDVAQLFTAAQADIYFDSPNIDPIHTSTFCELEVQSVYDDHYDIWGFGISIPDNFGRNFDSILGTAFYTSESYVDAGPGSYATGLEYTSLVLDIGFHDSSTNSPYTIHLVAESAVPEPSTLLLLGSGLVGLGLMRRKLKV